MKQFKLYVWDNNYYCLDMIVFETKKAAIKAAQSIKEPLKKLTEIWEYKDGFRVKTYFV